MSDSDAGTSGSGEDKLLPPKKDLKKKKKMTTSGSGADELLPAEPPKKALKKKKKRTKDASGGEEELLAAEPPLASKKMKASIPYGSYDLAHLGIPLELMPRREGGQHSFTTTARGLRMSVLLRQQAYYVKDTRKTWAWSWRGGAKATWEEMIEHHALVARC